MVNSNMSLGDSSEEKEPEKQEKILLTWGFAIPNSNDSHSQESEISTNWVTGGRLPETGFEVYI